ncbi:MAG: trigger factor [Bacilli bacterium]|nr:trigger factor [Bacilli bacterium]MDD4077524.1 trigger factor [Bacilli bacterium]MDD4387901.1 trigger factor [Bacilli bacterium]
MKVDIEKLTGEKVKLSIEFEKEEFARYYEEELNKILTTVEIKGFRKGKVPRDMYLRRFGEGKVLQQAFDQAVNDSYIDAVKNNKIYVIDEPQINIDFERFTNERIFSYTAEVAIYPEVKLGQYFGIEVEKDSTEITALDIDNYILDVRKSKSDLEIVEEAPLEDGNVAIFDFEGFIDGAAFPGGKSENYQLEIGSGSFIPGFEDQMIGMRPGEKKTITVTFPENYPAENLSGKPADFKIVLHEVKKRVLPELNDDFIKELNIPEIVTVDEYLSFIKDKLQSEKKDAGEKKFEYDLLKKVCDNAEVEIPEIMVDRKIDSYIKHEEERAKSYNLQFEQFLAYQGLDLEKYKKMIAEPARFDILKEVVLGEIINAEAIVLNDDDYEKGYQEIADAYHMPLAAMKKQFPKDQIEYYFLLKKTVDLLKEKAIIKE